MNHENYDIDFVITWVDGNDPKWREEYRKYKDVDEEDFDVRFRDWETLKYWFRGVEKYAPWVNKIYIVNMVIKTPYLQFKEDNNNGKL